LRIIAKALVVTDYSSNVGLRLETPKATPLDLQERTTHL